MIRIERKEDCCGCSACAAACPVHCIVLEEDDEGFRYAKADPARCTECGLYERVCPMLNRQPGRREEARVYAVRNRDEAVRGTSSSGGLFSLLAGETLAAGGTVFGARFDERFDVVHDGAETAGEALRFRGSKYVQSDTGGCYPRVREALRQGRPVLFSGTGCQIAGLKGFLGRDYPSLTCAEVACHGVPSPAVWHRFLAEQRAEAEKTAGAPARLERFSFRDKSGGWKRYRVTAHYRGPQGETTLSEPFYRNAFMRGFLRNLFIRPCCHACPVKNFASGADLMLADYWGVDRYHPDMDDDRGTSLAVTLTSRGEEALHAVENRTVAIPSTLGCALAMNRAIVRSEPRPAARELFFERLRHESVTAAVARLTRTPLLKRLRRRAGKLAARLGLKTGNR